MELTFITGVSKFSKVSIFSGLNNLIDLTLDPDYSAICGYTEADLDTVFAPELPGLDRDDIRAWYNGYSWLGRERVYNPFGLLKLFRSRVFKAHWFESATPRFLVDALIRRGFAAPDIESLRADDELLSAFDVEAAAPEGAPVPDRLRDHRRDRDSGRVFALPAGLPEPRGAAGD